MITTSIKTAAPRYSLVIGGVALDEIALPTTHLSNIVGGSAIYGSLASSLFSPTLIGGIAGNDFPKEFIAKLRKKNIDLRYLQKSTKPSFRWSGRYSDDLTHITNLNESVGAFGDFSVPDFKANTIDIGAAFISNNDPSSQIKIMKRLPRKTIKVLDSMDVWVLEKRNELLEAMSMADVLLINEAEAKLLFRGNPPIPELIEQIMQAGPRVVVYKKGEHGLVMYGRLGTMVVPSYPFVYAIDPSGAGDVLGGSLAGVLAGFGALDEISIKTAIVIASTAASFVVEDYATDGIAEVTPTEIINRARIYLQTMPFPGSVDLSRFV